MESTLNYSFKRQSENHLDWLINIIKSEKYYEVETNAYLIGEMEFVN
jgi:hypothetical protein